MKRRGKKMNCLISALMLALVLTLCFAAASPCALAASEVPKLHVIPYPAELPTTQDGDGADAFDGALDHAPSRYFVINDYYNMQSDESLHILSGFETYQQTTEYSCGAASALMVLHRFGVDEYDELEIVELAHTDTSKGTSVEGLADFFRSLGWNVELQAETEPRFADIEEAEAYLIEKLDDGIPVMVDWVDWHGHWQVVIGLDKCGTEDPCDDVLIFADPYDITDHYQDGYYIFSFERFFDMWHEGPCAQKEVPYEQPFVAAWPAA